MRRRAFALAVLAAWAALAGCGLGAGEVGSDAVSLRVTTGFGTDVVAEREQVRRGGGDSVMRLLQRNAEDVRTRYGGGFVQAIDGRSGGRRDGRRVDWFYFVNGVLGDQGAAQTDVHDGDRIWWDLREWEGAMHVPAVVGSFPEPFQHGVGGKRLPLRLQCAPDADRACDAVADRLSAVGVRVARAAPQAAGGEDLLRVVVGRWGSIREDRSARLLEGGPRVSGVFARPAAGGDEIAVLGTDGEVARRLRGDAGLVAATRYRDEAPTWIVTGTTERGLLDAAAAVEEGTLSRRFALAVADGLAVPAPAVRR